MKKKITILIITCFIISLFSFSQDSLKQNKKDRFCLVKLAMMDHNFEKYILAGFRHDTLYGFPFVENKNKKIIQMTMPLGIKSVDIKRVSVKIDKNVYMSSAKMQADTSISMKTIKSNIAEDHIVNATIDFVPEETLQMMSDPFSFGLGLTLIAIDLLLPPGKTYNINGSEKKFYKMTKDFSPKKGKK